MKCTTQTPSESPPTHANGADPHLARHGRKSRPLILTLGAIYNLRTRKPVNTIYGCICPNCRHKCILHVDGRSLKKAIRLWNHHASHHQRNEQ